MKYQLVLQWSVASEDEFEALLEVEEVLIEDLSALHDVDGHDIGSSEFNIFIHTNDPESAFGEVRRILGNSKSWFLIRIAYRERQKSGYVILWPAGLTKFEVS